jgi:hypothetical protein
MWYAFDKDALYSGNRNEALLKIFDPIMISIGKSRDSDNESSLVILYKVWNKYMYFTW